MKVLVACEESQRVCMAFRERGHEAYSCDMQECSGGHPEWHIQGDVTKVLDGRCTFQTADTHTHTITGKWDLIIAHPPCTYLTNAGACRLYKVIDGESYIKRSRFEMGLDAKDFFLRCLNADCDRVAIENPIPTGIYRLPPYTQTIQPYEYGEPYSKKTCLWLKGLPELKPTKIVEPICSWVSGGSKKADGTTRENKGMTFRDSKRKSKTFPGIAKAMAEQWG
jgi:hypothetical protein